MGRSLWCVSCPFVAFQTVSGGHVQQGTKGALLEQSLIPPSDQEAWTQALEGIEHAFAHGYDNCAAFALSQDQPSYLYSARCERGRVAVPVTLRSKNGHTDLVSPYGFSGFASVGMIEGFEEEFAAFAEEQGWVCGYIAQHPMVPLRYFGSDRAGHLNRIAYVIDLSQPVEDLVRRLSQNRRRQMRHWSHSDLSFDQEELLAFVLGEREQFYDARSAASLYYFSDATWRALAASSDTILIGRREKGRIVAASIFAWAGEIGDYLFNISVPEGQPASAQLIWEAALLLKQRGITSLTLGGGISEGDGVAQFKRRFGPDSHPLISLRQVYRVGDYRALCQTAGVSPEIGSGFFPPYYKPARKEA